MEYPLNSGTLSLPDFIFREKYRPAPASRRFYPFSTCVSLPVYSIASTAVSLLWYLTGDILADMCNFRRMRPFCKT
ncbi:hypothetical protein KCP69_05045 [Salmonella enterica subsp. enterica]|nr:hypothetical protein KCP69_05045 [Salmonella enterica subsp. enterica]